jgi:hypothetical protein
LKPANIKVRSDGTVKVLDFGLAKAMEPAGAMSTSVSMSPTLTTPAMTQAGMILGTAAYMSPEQAKGRPADKRSDLWSFGCVLFEMLTGARAFAGEDVADTLAAVLRGDPDWSVLPASTPAGIRRLLRLCLERDPRKRLQSAADARIRLTEESSVALASPATAVAAPVVGRSARVWQATAAVFALVAAALAAYAFRQPVAAEQAEQRTEIVTPALLIPIPLRFRQTGGRSYSWPRARACRSSGCGRWPTPRHGRFRAPTARCIPSGLPTHGPLASLPKGS